MDTSMKRRVFQAASDGNLTLLRGILKRRSPLEVEHYLSATTNGRRPLNMACHNGHLAVAEYILKIFPAALETPGKVSLGGKYLRGLSPLCSAVFGGHLEVVKLLLSKGANINCKTAKYYTPLMLACLRGSLELVKYLVAHGADINYVDPVGYTVLHEICRFPEKATSLKAIMECLICEGADVNIRNYQGKILISPIQKIQITRLLL